MAGIERPLGAGGSGLSAGQAQLLALARVWLRQPDLLVLDEATARVDPETERRLSAAVAELMVGRTTFVIAHRLSTLDMVDEVMTQLTQMAVANGIAGRVDGDFSAAARAEQSDDAEFAEMSPLHEAAYAAIESGDFDAAVAALGMAEHTAELASLPAADPAGDEAIEGALWRPGVTAPRRPRTG